MLSEFEKLQVIFGLVSCFGIIIAAITYRNNSVTISKENSISLISFFSDKILIKNNELFSAIKKIEPNYVPKPFFIKDFNPLSFLESKDNLIKIKEQYETLKKQGGEQVNGLQSELLNLLEEFSFRVLLHNTEEAEDLTIIKYAYINLIEKNILGIIIARVVSPGNANLFDKIERLYRSWAEEGTDRKPQIEILADKINSGNYVLN